MNSVSISFRLIIGLIVGVMTFVVFCVFFSQSFMAFCFFFEIGVGFSFVIVVVVVVVFFDSYIC